MVISPVLGDAGPSRRGPTPEPLSRPIPFHPVLLSVPLYLPPPVAAAAPPSSFLCRPVGPTTRGLRDPAETGDRGLSYRAPHIFSSSRGISRFFPLSFSVASLFTHPPPPPPQSLEEGNSAHEFGDPLPRSERLGGRGDEV